MRYTLMIMKSFIRRSSSTWSKSGRRLLLSKPTKNSLVILLAVAGLALLLASSLIFQIAQGERMVYMDSRPHPPAYAPHTFTGFSTGRYDGNVLTVATTHMKRGWIRANGVAESDEASVVEHFIRHDDVITVFAVTTDPVYLSEPFSK